jgi:hypothetical protein
MTRPNGAAIEEAAITPKPRFGERPDVFASLEEYELSPADVGIVGEIPVVLQVKFGRPRPQEWVCCHPDPGRMRYYHVVKDDRRNKLFVVHPRVASVVGSNAKQHRILQAITTEGDLYLWPAPIEGRFEADIGHFNAQQMALKGWIRVEFRFPAWHAVEPAEDLGEPQWPDLDFKEVLTKGFAGHMIDTEDHPFIRHMLGRK